MPRPTALVRRPSPLLADGLVTHIARRPVDVDLAQRQWQSYVDALQHAGWVTVEVAPADDCPDGVFVEDAMVVAGRLAVRTRPGAAQRRQEVDSVAAATSSLGLAMRSIEAPGTLDGGDVLKVGRTAYVGRGGRTDDDGMDQLAALLAPEGWRVVPVDVTKALHLKSVVTALPDGTVVGDPRLVDDPSVFPDFLAVPEESGAHVMVLGQRQLLMASDAPETAALFRARGYEPVCVDISEFQKLEGCVTCLSVRVRPGG